MRNLELGEKFGDEGGEGATIRSNILTKPLL